MNPPVLDLRSSRRTPDPQVARVVRQLAPGSGFDEAALAEATAAVLGRGDPPRDSIVLAEARRRRDLCTPAALAAWQAVLAQLAEQFHPDTYRLWFEPLRLVGEYEGALLISGPARTCRWVARRYAEVLNAAVCSSSDFDGVALEREQ